MSKQTEAERLIAQLESAVQIYPQISEDEPGGYATEYDQMVAEAAAELRRLAALNAELVAGLKECVELAWFVDSHAVTFDSTVMFGPGYDYSGVDGYQREEFRGEHDCVVWPSSGIGPDKWSAYCTYDGSMWLEKFDTAAAAKEACMALLDTAMPDHPAMKARALIAKAEAAA